MKRRAWRSCGVFWCGVWLLGCGTTEDVAGILLEEVDVRGFRDGGRGFSFGEGLLVVGRTEPEWPFRYAEWPLTTPLAEFFAEADSDGAIYAEGEEAALLRELWERMLEGEFGPPRDALAVEDHTGARYLLVVREARRR